MSELIGIGAFEDTAANYGKITTGEFNKNSINVGSVLNTATFANSSLNVGALSGYGVFLDKATSNAPSSTLFKQPVIFSGQSKNTGVVKEAIFIDSAVNAGTVTVSAVFANTSSNTGTIQGSAIFVNNSTNSGIVQNAILAANVINTGTIANSAAYIEPNGYFVDGYYINRQKISPAGWPIVANSYNGYWFNYNSSGSSSLATGIYNDGVSLFNFKNGLKTTQVPIVHPYIRLDYAANDNVLFKGSVLWNNQHAAATVASNLSGIYDLDNDGNLDTWTTNSNGVLDWNIRVYHPYRRLGYYADDVELINGHSVLWSTYYSGATTVKNVSGYSEMEEDRDDEIWYTNGSGTLFWYTLTSHPYKQLGIYYTDTPTVVKGITVIWDGVGTGGLRVTLSSGQFDVDADGNEEVWTTDSTGVITFAMISAHPYRNLGYYTDTEALYNGVTVVWSGAGTGATVVANSSSTWVDLNGDGNTDTWITDSYGVVSWSNTQFHPFSKGLYFADVNVMINGTSVLWSDRFSSAVVVSNLSGIADLNADGNEDQWSTNGSGVVTFNMVSAHPYVHFGYYSDDQVLVKGQSILWNNVGTGATKAVLLSGYADVDRNGDLDIWHTNSNGVVTWESTIVYPYAYFGYFAADYPLVKGTTVLYTGQTIAATVVASASGIADIDNDANNDLWSTGNNGVITWYMVSAHPYQRLGFYSNSETLTSNSSVLYRSQGSGSVVANLESGSADVDGDNNLDQWSTSANGTLSWYMISAYAFSHLGYYSGDGVLGNGTSVLHDAQGTGASLTVNVSGVYDIDGDTNDDQWATDTNGIITWYMISAYAFSHLGFYSADQTLHNNSSVLYRTQGTGALVANTESGVYDIDGDTNDDQWATDANGIITWYMISAYEFSHLGYYSEDIILANGTSVLHNAQGTGASITASVSGIYDIDGDTNDDQWITDQNGIITWYMISAHPFDNLGYYSTEEILINGSSILYNSRGTGATVAANLSGIYDVDQDGNNDVWTTDQNGVVSWTLQIVHPYRQVPNYQNGEIWLFSNEQNLAKEVSVLYKGPDMYDVTGKGTGATAAANLSGIYDIEGDNNNDQWVTDSSGAINWYMLSAYPYYYSVFGGYSEYSSISSMQETIIRNAQGTGASPIDSTSGIFDVDSDGNDDAWSINFQGKLAWYMISAYPYSINLGGTTYYHNTVDGALFNGTTVLYNTQGTGANFAANLSGTYDFNDDASIQYLDQWFTDAYGVLSWTMISAYPFAHIGYYSDDQFLQNGVSKLYTVQGVGGAAAASLSGTDDVNGDTNVDVWSTNESGVITWYMISAYPNAFELSNNTYYYAGAFTQGVVLYQSKGTGATLAPNGSNGAMGAAVDIDGDGNNDEWNIQDGELTWFMLTAYSYSYLGYYSSDYELQNGNSILYYTQGSGATKVANLTGISNLGPDQNNDYWSTNNNGVITWYMISAHPYANGLGGFYDEYPPVKGSTIVWDGAGTGAAFFTNLSGIDDIDGDGNLDDWTIDENGKLNWSMHIEYPNSIALGSNPPNHIYYYQGTLTQESTVIYDSQGSAAQPIASDSGVYDFNEDSNMEHWDTDASGIITWFMVSAHPNTLTLGNSSYYYEQGNIVNGTTILYDGMGTGALSATNNAGTEILDGRLSDWTITNGTFAWIPVIVYDKSLSSYYYQGTLAPGTNVLFDGQYSDALPVNGVFGTADIDEDGNIDDWFVNSFGGFFWEMKIVYPNTITLGSNTYYYDGLLASETTRLYNSQGSGATLAASASGIDDFDPAEGAETWSINLSGIISWGAAIAYPNYLNQYFYAGIASQGVTTVYDGQAATSNIVPNVSGLYDVDADGNLDEWYTDIDGKLTWATYYLHPNNIDLGEPDLFYYDGNLTNGSTVLYNSYGSGGLLASSLSGQHDFDPSSTGEETWFTNLSGVLYWSNFTPTMAGDSLFYTTPVGGAKELANGIYSTGAFLSGNLNQEYNNNLPQQPLDNSNWYTYTTGAASLANSTTPIETPTNSDSWYTYTNGIQISANGAYSNGYYAAGVFDNQYDNDTPQAAADNNLNYTYQNGSPTLAQEGYSNGYFQDGVQQYVSISSYAYGQDTGKWYVFFESGTSEATGPYSNGYYAYGVKDVTYTNPDPIVAQDDSCWYVYTSGSVISFSPTWPLLHTVDEVYYTYINCVRELASGGYAGNYDSIGIYLSSGVLDTTYTNPTPVITQPQGWSQVYVNGVGTPASGAYSTGYYGGSYIIGAIDSTYNSIPRQVQDNSKWYRFETGLAYLATGAFSNYYFTSAGDIDSYYNNSAPQEVQDEFGYWYVYANGIASRAHSTQILIETPAGSGMWYTYSNGVQTPANGAYNDGYYLNGQFDSTFTDLTPQSPLNFNTQYIYYIAGVAHFPTGHYTNGYYNNGVKDLAYTQSTPQNVLDNGDLYYVYLNGSANPAGGFYTNGVFNQGLFDSTITEITPQIPTDSVDVWYVYSNGAATTANGAYSNGYYNNGSIHTGGNYSVPQQPSDSSDWYTYVAGVASLADSATPIETPTASELWYTYSNGVQAPANGAYTNGYYANAVKNNAYDATVPEEALDNYGFWYVYATGVASLADSATPMETPANSGFWYTYSNGVRTAANGAYSNGYYYNGEIDTNYTNEEAQYSIDFPEQLYVYTQGVPTQVVVNQSWAGIETNTPNWAGVETPTPNWAGVETNTPNWAGEETLTPNWAGEETLTPGWTGEEIIDSAWVPTYSNTPGWAGEETLTPNWSSAISNNPNWTPTYSNTPDWPGEETLTPNWGGVDTRVFDEEGNLISGYEFDTSNPTLGNGGKYLDTSNPTPENGGKTQDERTEANGGLIVDYVPTLANGGKFMDTSNPTPENGGKTQDPPTLENGGKFLDTSNPNLGNGGKFMDTSDPNLENGGKFMDTSDPNLENGGKFMDTSDPNVGNGGTYMDTSDPTLTNGGKFMDTSFRTLANTGLSLA